MKIYASEPKIGTSEFGNRQPEVTLSIAGKRWRPLSAAAHRLAARLEELSENHRWVVRIGQIVNSARLSIWLELAVNNEDEANQGLVVLRTAIQTCVQARAVITILSARRRPKLDRRQQPERLT